MCEVGERGKENDRCACRGTNVQQKGKIKELGMEKLIKTLDLQKTSFTKLYEKAVKLFPLEQHDIDEIQRYLKVLEEEIVIMSELYKKLFEIMLNVEEINNFNMMKKWNGLTATYEKIKKSKGTVKNSNRDNNGCHGTVTTIIAMATVTTMVAMATVATMVAMATATTMVAMATVTTMVAMATVPTMVAMATVPTMVAMATVTTMVAMATVTTMVAMATVTTMVAMNDGNRDNNGCHGNRDNNGCHGNRDNNSCQVLGRSY
ncbi:hypothetical protein FQR65_LT09503 [Abscondita terminalis]|nr:hypothetical protein FQR65_LT09503 [Abscondita terminalis]